MRYTETTRDRMAGRHVAQRQENPCCSLSSRHSINTVTINSALSWLSTPSRTLLNSTLSRVAARRKENHVLCLACHKPRHRTTSELSVYYKRLPRNRKSSQGKLYVKSTSPFVGALVLLIVSLSPAARDGRVLPPPSPCSG